ncbi:MAG: hypothetical protein CMH83_00385 [Nocardioides sp.]|nr:hypothetical protein [Nocardioides sp.]
MTVLVTAGLMTAVPDAADAHPRYYAWGTTAARDQKLKKGCHDYTYRYRIAAPTDEWAAEIFIKNKNGRFIASNAIDTASDPDRGALTFHLCRRSTAPGRHTIKMKITWQDGRDQYDGWVPPTRFKLYKRR